MFVYFLPVVLPIKTPSTWAFLYAEGYNVRCVDIVFFISIYILVCFVYIAYICATIFVQRYNAVKLTLDSDFFSSNQMYDELVESHDGYIRFFFYYILVLYNIDAFLIF